VHYLKTRFSDNDDHYHSPKPTLSMLNGSGGVVAVGCQRRQHLIGQQLHGPPGFVDYLPDEPAASAGHQIATISAPVIDVEGAVVMSVTAAPFSTLSPDEVDVVGSAVRGVSRQIATQLGSGD